MDNDNIPEELKRFIQQQVDNYNNRAEPDFEGYSPKEMGYLIHNPFDPESPVRFNRLSEIDLQEVPLFRQVFYLASLVNEMKEIKLTLTGKLPLKVVSDIRSRKFLIDYKRFQREYKKLYREDDCYGITLSRLLLEVCGITKKSSKKLELTRKGRKLLADKPEFFKVMFESYTQRFNWAYGDLYEDEITGHLGWAYSLALVAKYGKQPHPNEFYSEKYFKAFPQLLKGFTYSYSTKAADHCYSLRVFDHFMDYLGLVEIEYPKDHSKPPVVKKLPLFDRFVKVVGSGE